ncbi:MAG TPA: TonB-dependent receptor [Candidatus Aquilonibacter sp.]|nr:TonB-dependent receptor [Candidatus Aquilonibacter sp.]
MCIAGMLLATAAWSRALATNTFDQRPQQSENQLKQLSLAQLGDVEVTTVAKLPEEVWQTPAAVFVLTQDDIRRSGATSIPELLRLVPGVDVAREQSDQWAVGVRGFNSQFSKGLLVLIDGRSVYTPLFEGVYWDVQDLVLDDIDRIEVIRGPGGTIWGANAVNGVINIITKKAHDTQGGLIQATGGGPVNRFDGEVRWGASAGSNLQYRIFAKGFNRGPEDNPGGDPYDHWHQERGGFRADWQPTAKDDVAAFFMMYRGASGDQNQIGEYTPPAQLTVDGQQLVSGGDLMLRWDRRVSHGSSFYLQGYFDRTNRGTSQFTETRDTIDLDFIYNIASLRRNNIVLGAGLRESPSNIVQTQATVNFTPHQINNYVYSLFAQDTFQIVPNRLSFTAGTKLEDNNYSGWGWQPTGRLLWTPKQHITLWGAVSRALRTPGRVDRDLSLVGYSPQYNLFVQVAGDPTFQPEVLIGWEGGYRQLLRRNLYVDVATFHNQYDNVESYGTVTLSFPTAPYTHELITEPFANGLRGISNGIEIAPDWELTNWFQLRGSYSYLHIALHSKPGFSQTSYASSYEGSSPQNQASVQGVFTPFKGFEIVPDYRFVGSLPAQNIASYQTADLNIDYQVKEHLQLSATGRNLLQPRHAEFPGDASNVVEIRRGVYGGLGWTW